MVENKVMPAAEAELAVEGGEERQSYELAFHILPTVAEEEVLAVFDAIKAAVTKHGSEIFDEEAPERFDLAYEVVKHLEGKNRKFTSAYFGWVRFKCEAGVVGKIAAEMDANNSVLRQLIIRLTRVEEENPFRFHEALKAQKMVSTVEESEVVPDFSSSKGDDDNSSSDDEEGGEVDEKELDKALEDKEV
mgnify:CR=1 FL=1